MSSAGWDPASPLAALAVEQGIHCLPIPTPFAVGRVNCYLIDDDPLTLVDAGPNSGRALDELERCLRALGRRIEDLELLVISHQHMDHLGLVDILQKRSGAEVAALELIVPWMARYAESMEAGDVFAEAVMARHGIPDDIGLALRSVASSFRGWGAGATVTRPLKGGDDLALRDRTLRILHRPGHSPSDTVFHDEARRTLIAGDHLIKHISSNPLISRPPDAPLDDPELSRGLSRPRSLMIYIDSLRATREMQLDVILPGHGEAFDSHAALIDERLRMHDRRAAKLLNLVREEPRTAYELAQALWGNVAVTQAYLTLSEVLGHMDLLLDDGSVAEALDEAGVVHFEAR